MHVKEITSANCKAINNNQRAAGKQGKPATLRKNIFCLFSAVMFLTFTLEVYLGHFNLLSWEYYWSAWIPLIYSPLAAIACLLVYFLPNRQTVTVFRLLMWGSLILGLGGMYFHGVGLNAGTFRGDEQGWLIHPPLFAPLSFLIPWLIGITVKIPSRHS